MTFQPVLPSVPELWEGFLHLIYPELCVACSADLPASGGCFCFSCQLKCDHTDMYMVRENEFTDRFWGRLEVESGAALYYFSRKSPVQRALHELKYGNNPEIGIRIGRELGAKLRSSGNFDSVELIVPVPLHAKKERLRGYNQSAMFAKGLAESMQLPVSDKALARLVYSESQTRKKRMERFQNVGEVFVVKNKAALEGRHVLLVDDVLTTGATLEVCGQAIRAVPGTRLSLATIAIAMN